MPRQLKRTAKKAFAWLVGFIFVIFGIGLVTGVEIYWARVVIPERESLGTAVSVSPDKPESQNNGKLIQVVGLLGGSETLTDSEFNVAVDALRLRRHVWMWQWEQENVQSKSSYGVEDSHGKTTTLLNTKTYNYMEVWSEKLINSQSFYNSGHDNPTEMKIPARAVSATKVSLGAFLLSPELVEQIDNFQTVPISDKNLSSLDSSLQMKTKLDGDEIYIGTDPKQPAIGDLKVKFEYTPATTVSIIARQDGNNLLPFAVTKTASVALLQVGSHSIQDMTHQFNSDNMKWRAVAWSMGLVATLVGGLIMLIVRKSS
jgi:hypothetical protein